MTALINRIPKYVASRTLQGVDWTNTTLLEGEITDTIPRLKERHDRVIVPGSGGLIQSLLRHELADRLHVWIHPVLLGTGKRLFADGTVPAALRLTGSETFGSGAVLLRYEHAGRPTYGSF
jgi:dihydrofolate reductase